ncbi:MAG: alpha/beta hydrolase [Clostridia bacterium]|nr:alpha/beta hydrolase [Clostridia bacterium]
MTGLLLGGAKCDESIWDSLIPLLSPARIEILSYPHDILKAADSLDGLAALLYPRVGKGSVDFIIGHSMGGFLALRLLKMGLSAKSLILIESNPVPAGKPFRNLLYDDSLSSKVLPMLEKEAPFYSEKLLNSLKDGFDDCDLIRAFGGRLCMLYGDRGRDDKAELQKELNLPPDIKTRATIAFIPQSCHLPMLENPEATAKTIQKYTI